MMIFNLRSGLVLPVLGIIGAILLFGPELTWASSARIKFPPGITIGVISGPGQSQLTEALREYEFQGKQAGQGTGRTVLSGTVNMLHNVAGARETVPLERPSGPAYEVYKADPFLDGKAWLTEETPTRTQLEDFPLRRFTGSLIFDWQLSGGGQGNKPQSGQAVINIDRASGGYLAEQGLTPTLSSRETRLGRKKLEQRLVEELVLRLLLDVGRLPDSSEIESGSDPLSRKAKKLATQGNWEEARTLWLELLTLNPKYGPPLFNLGLYYERAGQPEEAWQYYQQAFVADTNFDHRAALGRLTQTLGRAGRLPKAR